ncbi:MAG: prepilin-type N-terminal cleavage/methylation domain-containing protein [Bacilli bacterium]|nr:prepilin-type N-terminal cleavage/methylation domain-containing protein [Bacilli bacterium]
MKKTITRKKRGLTLVELLAVIVVLAILLTIALPNFFNIISKTRRDLYDRQKQLIEDTTSKYVLLNEAILNEVLNKGDSVYITVGHLMNESLLDRNLKDPRTNEDIVANNKILITNLGDSRYKYEYIGEGEWSDWSPEVPIGSNLEVETATFYNYQEVITYYGDWSTWQDVAYDNKLKQVAEFIGTETEERTVYRYQDQEWLWYNQIDETVCSAVMPTGDGWVKGSACDSTPETVCSGDVLTGDGWIKGSYCGTETSTCRSSSPGVDWTIGDACSWNQTTTTCAIDGTGSTCAYTTESSCAASSPGTGWTKDSACDSATTTSCQYSSPGTGYVQEGSCGTETSVCKSSSPGSEWTASTVCTRQHTMVSDCLASAPNQYWTEGTICTQHYNRAYCASTCGAGHTDLGPSGGCSPLSQCVEISECRSFTPGTGWTVGSVCTRKWNWAGCHSDGTGTVCTRKYTRPQYNWTKITDTKWTYTRDVATKWYKTTTSCSISGTGEACQWYYTRLKYNYTRDIDTKWTYNRTVTSYTADYYSEIPTSYPYKDETKTRLTPWTDWTDVIPAIYAYRTIESKDQFRIRDILSDWSGNKLSNYVSEEELETILGLTIEEIKANPDLKLTSATVYRYRIKVY